MSDAECMSRIRNLLSDPRFKYRKLSTIAEAIGRDKHATKLLLFGMADVRGSRDNGSREMSDMLYTFA